MELESGLLKDGQMKRVGFTEEQIIGVLREHEAGARTADLALRGRQCPSSDIRLKTNVWIACIPGFTM
jgi:hypothetical protein